jgi:hypothetical protein
LWQGAGLLAPVPKSYLALFQLNVPSAAVGTGVLFDMLASREYKLRAPDSFYIAFIHRPAMPGERQTWLNDRDANGKTRVTTKSTMPLTATGRRRPRWRL